MMAADLENSEATFAANYAASHAGCNISIVSEEVDNEATEKYLTEGYNVEAIKYQVNNGKIRCLPSVKHLDLMTSKMLLIGCMISQPSEGRGDQRPAGIQQGPYLCELALSRVVDAGLHGNLGAGLSYGFEKVHDYQKA